MSKVFTRKDIDILTFNETFITERKPYRLYEHLNKLASQDIYVVDVTLIHAEEDNNLTHNHYMIRIVRPVFDVEVKTYHSNEFTGGWHHVRTEVFGYYESKDEALKIEKEHTDKNNSDVKFETKIRFHSPLNKSI